MDVLFETCITRRFHLMSDTPLSEIFMSGAVLRGLKGNKEPCTQKCNL